MRLAIFSMHPIQYHAPIFRAMYKLQAFDFVVFYCDRMGFEGFYNPDFKVSVKWDQPLLEGYESKFLLNLSWCRISGFFSRINPGIVTNILRGNFDVVLIHGYNTCSAWLTLLTAKAIGLRVIIRGEGIPKESPRCFKQTVYTWLASLFLRQCDAVMFSCKGNFDHWRSLGVPDKKLFFMPCAVDNQYFRAQSATLAPVREQCRAKLGIKKNDLVILMTARLIARKRPIDLIKAVKNSGCDNIFLLFVGDGMERQAIEEAVINSTGRAAVTGFVNQSELAQYYVSADAFAILSSYDASPKALNEAMNFGLPVVCSNGVGTVADLVRHGENGFVVGVGDVEAITDAIRILIADLELRVQMGTKSLEIVDGFTLEKDALSVCAAANSVLTV